MKKSISTFIIAMAGLFSFQSCAQSAEAPAVIQNFSLDRYLGTWYEIARLDHSFERDLIYVTANYSLRPDGKVKVTNRGFKEKKNRWSESVGKAKFAGKADEGRLKVSFFGPFYGAYNIVMLDEEYQYALILSDSPDYFWILSRTKTIPEEIKTAYLEKAASKGIDIQKIIWVKQE